MRARPRIVLLLSSLPTAACASPADVQADHDRTIRGYYDSIREAQDNVHDENARFRGDMATAQDWNHHMLGIPAAGWVAILISASVVFAIVTIVWLVTAHDQRELRRKREHVLALEQQKTRQRQLDVLAERVQRGNCQVCGAAPVPDDVLKEVTRDRTDR